ncbi:hypothetical protein BBJ28_00026387, partial [Nothophytophthora sp. Chile5]
MAPRNDEPAAEAAPPAAAIEAAPPTDTKPAPPTDTKPASPAATHVDLVFLYDGELGMCEAVDLKRNAMSLRLLVKKAFQLRAHPKNIHLFSLRREDGSWPDEDEAQHVQGTKLKYTHRIASEFPDVGDACEVHFRVEVEGQEENETAGSDKSDGAVSDVESCKQAMNDAVKFGNKRRACSETLPCHKFSLGHVKEMYKKIKQVDYTQREEELPKELMGWIR